MDGLTLQHLDPAALADQFVRRVLPKACWTHEAHLVVCWTTLQRHAPAHAVAVLRDQIRAYNVATGGTNTPTSGYHETLTIYYVCAVAASNVADVCDLARHPWCALESPMRHWTRERLFSVEARAAWREPDLAALPWRDRTDLATVTTSA